MFRIYLRAIFYFNKSSYLLSKMPTIYLKSSLSNNFRVFIVIAFGSVEKCQIYFNKGY